MGSSLGRRLALAFAATGLGAALLTALLVNLAFGSRFESYLEQQRSARERQLAAAFAAAYEAPGGWDLDRLDQLAPSVAMAGADVRLLDAGGTPVWPRSQTDLAAMARMHRAMTGTAPLADPSSVPVVVGGQRRGTLQVRLPQAAVPAADAEFRRAVNRLLIGGGLVAGGMALVVGLVFARRTSQPVAELTAAAREVRAGRRTRRAEVAGRDELAQLAEAFNDLVDASERQEKVRQSFTADVAHELRTPLTVLRSQLEAVQDGVADLTPALVTSLHEETLRLGRLAADLETMTTADAVSFSLERRPVDLADVAASSAAALEHRFAEEELSLVLRLGPAPVCGDEARLQQVVTNLLTNTLKFVPAGGTVTVTTGAQAPWAELAVSDDGPGIPAEELPLVFQRFFRGRRARTGGSGIGLAVVSALVEAHGGRVEATSIEGGGAAFRVQLPLAAGARRQGRVPPGGTAPRGRGRVPATAGRDSSLRPTPGGGVTSAGSG